MDLLEKFHYFLLSQKKKPSKATVKNYKADISQFIRWVESEQKQKFNPSSISSYTLDQYKKYKTASSTLSAISARSIDRHFSSLRKFFHFLKLEKVIAQDPFEQMKIDSANIMAKKDPWLLLNFKNYLYVYNASHLTIKNYIIDIRQFLDWAEEVTGVKDAWNVKQKNVFDKISSELVGEYKDRLLHHAGLSPLSINRKLSSIRKYIQWAQQENLIKNYELGRHGRTSLLAGIKNYDKENETTSFPEFAQAPIQSIDATIPLPLDPKHYSSFAPLRVLQKITKGIDFLFESSIIALLAKGFEGIDFLSWQAKGKPVFRKHESTQREISKNAVPNIPKSFYAPTKISTKFFPMHKKILWHVRHNRPEWYKRYQHAPLFIYFRLTIFVILLIAISLSSYKAFFEKPKQEKPAFAAIAPLRILSFQGKLTDTSNNPITTPQQIRFIIYNQQTGSGSARLWEELDNISPDASGIFSVLLGSNNSANANICNMSYPATSACGIPQSLFANNAQLWLGVTIGNGPELAPRQQLATVAYATSAEVLQGLPPTTDVAWSIGTANTNAVLALNASGTVAIPGSGTTTLQATSGQFTVTGQTVALQTNVGSVGNIALSPDGIGFIDLQKPIRNSTNSNNVTTATGAVEIDDMLAVLATSSGQSAFTINQNGTGPIISASSSGTAMFTLDYVGNGYFAGNLGIGSTAPAYTVDVAGNVNISTGSAYKINGTNMLTGTTLGSTVTISSLTNVGALSSGTIATGFGTITTANTITGTTLNGTTGINTGASAGSQRIDSSGNLKNIGTTQFNTVTYTWPSADATAGYTLTTNGSGTLSWADPSVAVGNFWRQNSGTLYPANSTVDLLVGSTATSSAKFGFLNVNSGTPVASISANSGNNATYLTGDGTLATTNGRTLTIGGTTTGAIALSPASATPSLYVANGGNVGIGTTNPSSFNLQIAGHVGPQTNNTYDLGSSSLAWRNMYGYNFITSATSGQNGWFQRSNNALSPTNITDDLLLGSTATTSAKFGFLNVAGGTPTASISANSGNNATYVTGLGNLATTNAQTLTLGGSTTGNIVIDSGSSLITLADPTTLSSTLTVSSTTALNGNTTLGTNTANTIAFNGRISSIIDPSTGSSYDLGSSSRRWATIYGDTGNFTNISGTVTGGSTTSSDWLINSDNATNDEEDSTLTFDRGTLATNVQFKWNSTSKQLTTNSPSFAILGDTGIASYSGTAAFIVNQIQTQDILSASASGVTKFTVGNNGNITATGTLTGLTGLSSSGTITFSGFSSNGGVLYTNGSGVLAQVTAGAAGQCLLGGSTPSFGSCETTDAFWNQSSGALYPNNATVDLLVGATATTSAKFAVLNINSGTPVASISANSGNNATYLTGDGTLATTNKGTLTIGSASTGNLHLLPSGGNVGIGSTTPGTTLDVTGTGRFSSTLTANTFVSSGVTITGGSINNTTIGASTPSTGAFTTLTSSGNTTLGTGASGTHTYSTGAGSTTTLGNSTGALTVASGGTSAWTNTSGNLTISTATSGTLALDSAGALNIGPTNATSLAIGRSGVTTTINGTTTFSSFSSNGGVLYTNGTGVLAQVTAGTASQCLLGGTTPSFGSCQGGQDAFWNQGSGALFANNSTVDLLIGGQATTSAKFAVLNVAVGTPTASVSAGTAGATYLTADGKLATTAKQPLTIGDSTTTGDVYINPSGNIGVGTTTAGAKVDVNGNILVAGGGTIDTRAAGTLTIGGTTQTGLTLGRSGTTTTFGSTAWTATPTISGLVTMTSGFDSNAASTVTALTIDGNTGNALTISGTSFATDIVLQNGETIDNDSDGTILLTATTTQTSGNLTVGSSGTGTITSGTINSQTISSAANFTGTVAIATSLTSPIIYGGTNAGSTLTLAGTSNGTPANAHIILNGTSQGNVGIGTTSPLAALDIRASNNTSPAATVSANSTFTALAVDNRGNGDIFSASNSGVSRFTITKVGNVGIGTTLPSHRLEVAGNVNLLTATDTYKIAGTDVLSATTLGSGITTSSLTTVGALASGSIASGFGTIATANTITGTTINGTTGINTGAGGGTNRIDVNGNLVNIGTTQFNTITYTWPSSGQAAGYTLTTNGSGTLSWADPANAVGNFWRQNSGALYPANATVDLLIGAQATTSAKFAVLNVGSGTPTASVSAGVAGGAYLTATGTLATTAKQALLIGDSTTTGDVIINPSGNIGIGSTTPGAKVDVTGTGRFSGLLTASSGLTATTGNIAITAGVLSLNGVTRISNAGVGTFITGTVIGSQTFTTNNIADSGALTIKSASGNALTLDTGGGTAAVNIGDTNATSLVFGNTSTNPTFAFNGSGTFGTSTGTNTLNGNVVIAGSKTLTTGTGTVTLNGSTVLATSKTLTLTDLNSNGGVLYANGSGVVAQATAGTSSQCLLGGTTPSFGSCQGGQDAFWNQGSGALFANNSTVDLLIGGQATTSAKFAVLNIAGGTPVASISANSGNNATYLTGDGTLARTNRGTLTIGNSSTYNTTGEVLINPNGTGNVGIGTTIPGSKLEVKGSGTGKVAIGEWASDSAYAGVGLAGSLAAGAYNFLSSPSDTNVYINRPSSKTIYFRENNDSNAQLTIETGGFIGIGTTDPGQILQVTKNQNGNTIALLQNTTGDTSAATYFQTESNASTGYFGTFSVNNTDSTTLADSVFAIAGTDASAGLILSARAAAPIKFYTNGSETNERMRIDSNGNVGIGTTTPVGTLNVHGTLNTRAGVIVNVTTSNDIFTASVSGSPKFVIKNSGYVGIGTTLPQGPLDIAAASGATAIQISNADISGATAKRWLLYPITDGVTSESNLQFYGPQGDAVTFRSNGNVGIGSTVPGAKLDVTGTGRFSSTLTASNGFTVTAGGATITAGSLGVGVAQNPDMGIRVLNLTAATGANQFGVYSDPIFTSDATAQGAALFASFRTAAASFTLTNGYGLKVDTTNMGASSAVTNLYGVYIANQGSSQVTNNYGLYVAEPSNAGTLNVAAYFGGNVGIGTTGPNTRLEVVNSSTVTTIGGDFGQLIVRNTDTTANNYVRMNFATYTSTSALASVGEVGWKIIDHTNGAVDADFVVNTFTTSAGWNERLRIDGGTGNVGIGTTSPIAKLDIQTTTNSKGAMIINGDGNQTLFTASASGSTKFIVDKTGNVGIGTTLPNQRLDLNGGNLTMGPLGTAGYITFRNDIPDPNTTGGVGIKAVDHSGANNDGLGLFGQDGVSIRTGNSMPEVFRVFQSGNVGIGTTMADIGLYVYKAVTNNYIASFRNSGGNSGDLGVQIYAGSSTTGTSVQFYSGDGNTTFGNISTSGGATAYNASSDIRLKENILETPMGLSDLMKIKVKDFAFKSDPTHTVHTGFIAQELYEVFPDAVTVPESAEKYWSIDYGKVTPLLVKSVQEQQVQIASGTATLTAHANIVKDITLTSSGDLTITQLPSLKYQVANGSGTIYSRISAFAESVIGNLRVGMLNAQSVTANALTISTENITIAGVNLKDYITSIIQNSEFVIQNGDVIVSPLASIDQIKTNVISPLASNKIEVTGNVVIKPATPSGQLALEVQGDASVSGTLRAGRIIADDIEGLQARIGTLAATTINNVTNIYSSPSASSTTGTTITGSASTNFSLLSSAIKTDFMDIASMSGTIAYVENLTATFGQFNQGLIALGPTGLTDVSVANQLSVGGHMTFVDNTINTLGTSLELQPLRQGNLSIMAGLINIDTDGNMTVSGNATFAKDVTVKGKLATNIISPLADKDLSISLAGNGSTSSALVVTNASGSGVIKLDQEGNIAASGSGTFTDIIANAFRVIRAVQADTSLTETVASGSAGTATIVQGETERTIINSNITEKSLIYLSPASDTVGQTPYIARQVVANPQTQTKASFTIQIPQAINKDIKMNWWIVN